MPFLCHFNSIEADCCIFSYFISSLCLSSSFVHSHRRQGHSNDLPTYILSHFTGILGATLVFFIAYCVYARADGPWLNNKSILPGLLCGCLWAVAQISGFYASKNLDQVVAFPILSSGPGLVGALWGIFVFGEIKGAKNLGVVVGAFLTTIAGVVCIALSKK